MKDTAADLERIRFDSPGLASRREAGSFVTVIAERLVGGLATAAERRALKRAVAREIDSGMDRVGTVFADVQHIDDRRRFLLATIVAFVSDGAGRASVSDGDTVLDGCRLRMEPWPFDVRKKHARGTKYAVP